MPRPAATRRASPSTAAAARAAAAAAAARQRRSVGSPAQRGPLAARVRWDRVARCALLFVLVVVVALYIGPARSYLSTLHQAQAARAQVATLARQNERLRAQRHALESPLAVRQAARRLGLVRQGEVPFVVRGLPPARRVAPAGGGRAAHKR